MDSIHIETGAKRIAVERDGKNVGDIVFDPSDILFAEKFYRLISEFDGKVKEYQSRSDASEAVTGLDENGLPLNLQDRIDLVKDANEFMRAKIDDLFGKGTSQIAFGDSVGLDMFSQFFDGITPYIRTVRENKIAKYIQQPAKPRKRSKK